MSAPVLLLLIAGTLVCSVSADLPVNCSHDSIRGSWRFYVGEGGHDNSIACSRDFAIHTQVTIELANPDVATLHGDSEKGFWTMVFNQGFEVVVGGRKYFAFSNYTGLTGARGISHCHSTLNGWVHDISGENWACYFGVKNASAASISEFRGYTEDTPILDWDRKYVKNLAYVERVNSAAQTWTATHYPELEGMTLRDRLMRAGGLAPAFDRDTTINTGGGIADDLHFLAKSSGRPGVSLDNKGRAKKDTFRSDPFGDNIHSQQSGRRDYSPLADSFAEPPSHRDAQAEATDHISAADLPASIDWRDIDGESYVPPVPSQGSCGSCYAVATMSMMYSRFKILSKGAIEKVFSAQDVVSCSEYSQGCLGGFPYLVGKYADDFGIVGEECFPYTASDDSCSVERKGCPRYYAKDYRYIGQGYYGGCSEHAMMVELVENGPFAVGYNVVSDFQLYSSGIYRHTQINDQFNPWMPVNHAVLVIGYGVENGVKYWIAQNSWGTRFGEGGYFRISRGNNEVNFESAASAATPILPEG